MNNDQVLLLIGDFAVYWHGIIIALALAAGIFISYRMRRSQTDGDCRDILIIALFTLPSAFIGARIFYCWCFDGMFSSFFSFGNGGFAMPGAIVGAFLGAVIPSIFLKYRIAEMLDALAVGSAAAIAIGRWAAMFTGENLGSIVASESLQGMPYSIFCKGENVYRQAFFAWESVIMLVFTAFLLWLFTNKYAKHTFNCKSGDFYLLFVIFYFISQGIFESYRYDTLIFNTPSINKLQTVSATLCMGGLFAALPLAFMILRNIFLNGIKLRTLWHIPACAILYFGYFNIVLRIESENPNLNVILLILSAAALIGVGADLLFTPIYPKQPKAPARFR